MKFPWNTGPTIRSEITRNLAGYVLLILGVAVLYVGGTKNLSSLTKAGDGMEAAALIALQIRRTSTDDPNQNKDSSNTNSTT